MTNNIQGRPPQLDTTLCLLLPSTAHVCHRSKKTVFGVAPYLLPLGPSEGLHSISDLFIIYLSWLWLYFWAAILSALHCFWNCHFCLLKAGHLIWVNISENFDFSTMLAGPWRQVLCFLSGSHSVWFTVGTQGMLTKLNWTRPWRMIRIVAERIGELWPFQGEVFMYKRRWVEMGIMKGEHN